MEDGPTESGWIWRLVYFYCFTAHVAALKLQDKDLWPCLYLGNLLLFFFILTWLPSQTPPLVYSATLIAIPNPKSKYDIYSRRSTVQHSSKNHSRCEQNMCIVMLSRECLCACAGMRVPVCVCMCVCVCVGVCVYPSKWSKLMKGGYFFP